MRLCLASIDAVASVEVDLARRTVTVAHHAETARLAKALESLNLGARHLGDDLSHAEPERRVSPNAERSALRWALGINATLFVTELGAGLVAASMGLIADALDMGADASVYALSLAAVAGTAGRKRRLARTSGYLQLALAAWGLVEVLRRFTGTETIPSPITMIVVSLIALAGNVVTLAVLSRVRSDGVHMQASWIFTANDVKVNLLVIGAAILVAIVNHPAPDLVAGGFIFLIVANGARRILSLSRQEGAENS